MNIHEFETYARATIPVPTGVLIITQRLHTGISATPTVTWSISHFATGVYSLCTTGEGETPEGALANLIPQLTTPCTPSAPSESYATPSLCDSGMQLLPELKPTPATTTEPAAK
jgi:hypothetical protein